MGLDIRMPIGLMFAILALLLAYGLVTPWAATSTRARWGSTSTPGGEACSSSSGS